MSQKINFNHILKQIIKDNNDQYNKTFKNSYDKGENELYFKKRSEVKTFDEEWIDTLESYFPSLNNIILNPKNDLRYEQEVVLVEKARKITPDSIKHLASNTRNIKNVDEHGMVRPKRILDTYSEIEYATYENRFIKTLIERLFHFVRNRYREIKNNIESFNRTNIILNSNFPFNDEKIKLDINLEVLEDLENKEINEYNYKLLKRVEQLNKLIAGFYQSEFMKELEKARPIAPPIMKTQILLKNVDYNNAYLLWLFLDTYNTLPYELEVTELDFILEDNYLNNLEDVIMVNYLTLIENQRDKKLEVYDTKNIVKKGFLNLTTHPDDLLKNHKYLEIESNAVNEYYLKQQAKLFEYSINLHQKDVKLEETALRRAMRDLNSITDSIYDAYFDLDVDQDIFRRLLRNESPINEFNKLKDKSHFARVVREVKEVDLNNSIRLERRIIKRILELDKYIIAESHKRRILTAKELSDFLLTEHTKNKMYEYDNFLRELLEQVKLNREKIEEEKREAINKINELEKKLKEEEEEHFNKHKAKLEEKYKNEFNLIKEEHNRQLKRIKDRFNKEERDRNAVLERRLINMNKESSRRIVNIEEQLSVYFNNKLKDYENELNKELVKAKMASEEIQINNEFERSSIRLHELYSKELKDD